METLRRLGFQPGCLVETVLATYTPGGKPHAAPMGVRLLEDGRLRITPYLQTQTYRNLKASPACTVNLTWSPEIFFQTAFKGELEEKLPGDFFLPALKVRAPRLRRAEGWLEVEASLEGEDREKAYFKGEIVAVYPVKRRLKAYCRGDFAAIESIIHATRVLEFTSKGEWLKAEKLLRLMLGYRNLIGRVAPNSEASQVIERLFQLLQRKGVKIEGLEAAF